MIKDIFVHYTVDIEKIDNEHYEIIKLIEDISLCGLNEKDECINKLSKLENLLLVHSQEEEAYLFSINYPYLQFHKEDHRRIMIEFNKCKKNFIAFNYKPDRFLIQNLRNMFLSHIDHQDLQIANWLNKNRM